MEGLDSVTTDQRPNSTRERHKADEVPIFRLSAPTPMESQ